MRSGPTVPTFEITTMSVEEVNAKVWAGDVWGAIWANAGQSAVDSFLAFTETYMGILKLVGIHTGFQ